MANGLDRIAGKAASIQHAVQWVCDLEATAPKAGNVHPDCSFDDLSHCDFMEASTIAAQQFAKPSQPVSERALAAAKQTRETVGSNVNLGILLLLAPLVACDESHSIETTDAWPNHIDDWLSGLTEADSENFFNCIRTVSAGGLGKVDEMDVNDPSQTTDIVAAMRLARDRDRIALQWADGFRDLVSNVVPVVSKSMAARTDALAGIADAHLRLLVATPDSLIARKCGLDTALDVQRRAANVDLADPFSRQSFDEHLRSRGNKLNPGTTADLIAAALYVLMRTPNTDPVSTS